MQQKSIESEAGRENSAPRKLLCDENVVVAAFAYQRMQNVYEIRLNCVQNNDDVFMCDQVKYKKKQSEKHVLGEAARDACFERK